MEEPKTFLPNGHSESHSQENCQDMEVDSNVMEETKKTKSEVESISNLPSGDKAAESVEKEENTKKEETPPTHLQLEESEKDLKSKRKEKEKGKKDNVTDVDEKETSDNDTNLNVSEKKENERLDSDNEKALIDKVKSKTKVDDEKVLNVNKNSKEGQERNSKTDDVEKVGSSPEEVYVIADDIKKENLSESEGEFNESGDFCGFEPPDRKKRKAFGKMLDVLLRDCKSPTDEEMEEGSACCDGERKEEVEANLSDDDGSGMKSDDRRSLGAFSNDCDDDYADGDHLNDIFIPEVVCVSTGAPYSFKDELSSTSSTPSLGSSGSRKRQREKVIKKAIDVSQPQYYKPFEYGWKRELVYRNASDTGTKRNADIYYYTPIGKKVRSTREVLDFLLGTDLTVDNFTFFKEPIGLNDPEKEIIREAKTRGDRELCGTPPPSKKIAVMKTPKTLTSAIKTSPGSSKTNDAISNNNEEITTSPKLAGTNYNTTPKIVLKSFKPSLKTKTSKHLYSDKKGRRDSEDEELEMGMLPPLWPSPPDKCTAREISPSTNSGGGVKRPHDDSNRLPSAKRSKKESLPKVDTKESRLAPKTAEPAIPPDAATPAMLESEALDGSSVSVNKDYLMTNVGAIHNALLHSFQYLKVQELLQASRVCQFWKDIAMHRNLWRTVRMKNSRVRDWDGFANMLRSVGTKNLDLRKMLVSDKPETQSEMWTDYSRAIDRVNMLYRIDMCRCPGSAVERSARANSRLQYLSALVIRCNSLDMSAFENCKNLTELRLKSNEKGGMDLKKLSSLKSLTKMKHLSLTTVKEFSSEFVEILEKMKDLETLEIGECAMLSASVATDAIPKLKRLHRLRLEKGQGTTCPTVALLQAVSHLPLLTQLELINFDIKPGFDTALSQCSNLRTLLIIPTYVTQSATTNHVVMEGVSKLSKTLTHFVWGITLELLRVTDLFIDQWEGQKGPIKSPTSNAPKKGSGDSIPILKPLNDEGVKEGSTPSQVDILQLPKLHKVLTALLPSTKIKILKVPFSATWRQTVAGPSHSQ